MSGLRIDAKRVALSDAGIALLAQAIAQVLEPKVQARVRSARTGDRSTQVEVSMTIRGKDGSYQTIALGEAVRHVHDRPDDVTGYLLAFGRALSELGARAKREGWRRVRVADAKDIRVAKRMIEDARAHAIAARDRHIGSVRGDQWTAHMQHVHPTIKRRKGESQTSAHERGHL